MSGGVPGPALLGLGRFGCLVCGQAIHYQYEADRHNERLRHQLNKLRLDSETQRIDDAGAAVVRDDGMDLAHLGDHMDPGSPPPLEEPAVQSVFRDQP